MPFRFVHTADVHLDSPLESLALRDPDMATIVQGATRQAFVNIIDLCLEEQVDALLIAGDLYDGHKQSMETALFFVEQVKRLTTAGILVFMIKGNHDVKSAVTKQLNMMLPEGMTLFSGKTKVIEIPEKNVAIHGVSFPKGAVPDSLLPDYKQPVAGKINVGLMHTSLGGSKNHDVYAPCSVQDLAAHGFDYWALGHIHKRSVETLDNCTIVMAGIPQGRHINEGGNRSVSLVQITDNGQCDVEERSVHVAQFERLRVDVTGLDDWPELVRHLVQACQLESSADYLIVRLQVVGKTPLAFQLQRDQDLLMADLKQQLGKIYIEKIELQVQPLSDADDASNPITELATLMSDSLGNPALQAIAETELTALLNFLPADARNHFGIDETAQAEMTTTLMQQGQEQVLACLNHEPEEAA